MSRFSTTLRDPEVVYRRSREEPLKAERLNICTACNGVVDTLGRCAPGCGSERNVRARAGHRVSRTG